MDDIIRTLRAVRTYPTLACCQALLEGIDIRRECRACRCCTCGSIDWQGDERIAQRNTIRYRFGIRARSVTAHRSADLGVEVDKQVTVILPVRSLVIQADCLGIPGHGKPLDIQVGGTSVFAECCTPVTQEPTIHRCIRWDERVVGSCRCIDVDRW